MRSSRISEVTELAILKANGALRFETDKGQLWAIFDDEGTRVAFEDTSIASHSPQLTCRSSDVLKLELKKGARLSAEDREFTVREVVPDGTGQTTLILDES